MTEPTKGQRLATLEGAIYSIQLRHQSDEMWQAGVDEFLGQINDRVAALRQQVDADHNSLVGLEEAVVNLIERLDPPDEIPVGSFSEALKEGLKGGSDSTPVEAATVETSATFERYADALRLIAGEHCETFTGTRSCIQDPARSAFAKYGAEKWCDACIAWAALHDETLR